MSGVSIQQIDWVQIPGPTLAIDPSNFMLGGPYIANVRADNQAISIWETSGTPRRWQYWTPGAGWSAVFDMPPDYAGGVGWQPNLAQGDSSFITVENTTTGLGVQAVRVARVNDAGGYVGGDGTWWPGQQFWDVTYPPDGPASIAIDGFGTYASSFFIADALDNSSISYFVSALDPWHVWLYCQPDFTNPAIGSAFVGFNTRSGRPDRILYLDLIAGNYTQNFGRSLFLYTGAGVNTMVCSPAGAQAWGQFAYSAPFNSLPDCVLSVLDFNPVKFTLAAYLGASYDNTHIIGSLASMDARGPNGKQSLYFPNSGIPEYAWEAVAELDGAQRQMQALCYSDPFYGSLASGVQDAFAVVRPFHTTVPGPPDIIGLEYIPFWQGFQGLPIGIAWPVAAVAPFYGMLLGGVPYLIDSATPPQMFALSVVTASFAAIYGCANWVRMGDQ